MLPVSWLIAETMNVPMKDAPLPKMSMSPKNSPAFLGGMIWEKYDLDMAWMPPWNIPTQMASMKNCVMFSMNDAYTVMQA